MLEVSVLSQAAFEELGLRTIGDLADTTTVDFLIAAYRRARPDQRVAPALKEVKELLSFMDLGMANHDVDTPTTIEHDGPALPGFDYLGTFRTQGRLAFGEQRFLFGDFDAKALRDRTIDKTEAQSRSPAAPVNLVEIDVEPGLWDVYTQDGPFQTRNVLVQRRGVLNRQAHHIRHVGELYLADPIVFVVDAEARAEHFTRRALIGSARAAFDKGATAVLARSDTYEWISYTSEDGGNGPIRKFAIRVGVGE